MFAKFWKRWLVFALATTHTAAIAADDAKLSWKLTEEQEPSGKAWEDPARLSFTVDPNGEDIFSARINLQLEAPLRTSTLTDGKKFRHGRDVKASGYFRWAKESGGSDRQDNLELGAGLDIGRDLMGLYYIDPKELMSMSPLERTLEAERRNKFLDYAVSIGSGFARTASYADLDAAPCDTAPSLTQCKTQYSESIRTTAEVGFYRPDWQDLRKFDADKDGNGSRLAFIFSPKVGLAHDLLLNDPIDPATGLRKKGGYLSAVAGFSIKASPSFIDPRFELAASGQIRQSLALSSSREGSIDKTAEQFELSATYYPVMPEVQNQDLRLGLGLTYTHGHDPLLGEPKGDKIVFALKLGFY